MQDDIKDGTSWDEPAKAVPLSELKKVQCIAQRQGLYNRYKITEKDGQPVNPTKEYFVLELSDPDPREFISAYTFAKICLITGYAKLGWDIINKLFGNNDTVYYLSTDSALDMGPFTEKVATQLNKELIDRGAWAVIYKETVTEATHT